MIEFSIHIPSVFIGFFIGYAVIGALFLWFSFDSKWHEGFSLGWNSGKKFAEDRMKEKEREQNEPDKQAD